MTVDRDELLRRLRLVNNKAGVALGILEAVSAPPVLTRTIDGASTLTIEVRDWERTIVHSGALESRSWAVALGLHFELVAVTKTGDGLRLVFEDAIAAALRRRTKPLSIPAGSATRREVFIRLAREVDVKYLVDPDQRRKIARVIERSAGKQRTSSWDVGREVAADVNWRFFSDGRRMVAGSDDWLFNRDRRPSVIAERNGAVHTIDFDLDTGKRASEATVSVDAGLWTLPPGAAVTVEHMGPANGRWLVKEFTRTLTSTRGTVSLIRKRHELAEPKPPRRGEQGESGEPDFLPGRDGGSSSSGVAGNAARERMVQFALAQRGDEYVWGGNGPSGWDCSGLVQAATAAAGKVLTKPSTSQWAQVRDAGRAISVQQALATRGALLFRMSGYPTHVAISLGNGSTIEAMGSAYGVLVAGGAAGRTWTSGGLWL